MLFCVLGVGVMTNAHSKYEVCEENYPIPILTRKDAARYLRLGGDGCPVGASQKRYCRQSWCVKWNWDLMDYEAVETNVAYTTWKRDRIIALMERAWLDKQS